MIDWYHIKKTFPKSFEKLANQEFPNVGMPCVMSLGFFGLKNHFYKGEHIGAI